MPTACLLRLLYRADATSIACFHPLSAVPMPHYRVCRTPALLSRLITLAVVGYSDSPLWAYLALSYLWPVPSYISRLPEPDVTSPPFAYYTPAFTALCALSLDSSTRPVCDSVEQTSLLFA